MAGVILLALAFIAGTGAADTNTQATSDDIPEYNGPIGSDHPLYGLKLGLQDMDEAFTFNENDKLAKKIAHLEERIAEYRAAITKNNEKAAARALEVYEERSKDVENSVSEVSDNDNKGLENAYKMLQKHQDKLDEVMTKGHGKGLENAYANRVALLEKFRIKHNIEDDDEEDADDKLIDSIKIKTKISSKGNTTVEIDMKFSSGNHTNITIAQEIRNRFLALDKENITKLIKIENTSAEEKLTEELNATAHVKNNSSKVDVEYDFWMNETNKTKIVEGIFNHLNSSTNGFLNVTYIDQHLEIKLVEDAKISTLATDIRSEKPEKGNSAANRAKGKDDDED